MSSKDDIASALQPLVNDGTLSPEQRDAVVKQLGITVGQPDSRSLKGLLSEALVYLGGAIIFGSGALLISQTWKDLGRWGRPGVLVVAAVVMWVAGRTVQHRKNDDEGRRLSSTLFTGGAILVGVAVNNLLSDVWIPRNADGNQDWSNVALWVDPAKICIAMTVTAVFVGIGYRISNSALALVATGGALLGVSMSSGQYINYLTDLNAPRYEQFHGAVPWLPGALTAIGSAIWLVMWSRDLFKEKVVAHLLGLVGLFIALNTFREDYDESVIASLLVATGILGLWLYVQSHQWPYLVFGLGSILVGGLQLLFKYVEGVGGALASMGLGAVLVGLGIWLVKDRSQQISK